MGAVAAAMQRQGDRVTGSDAAIYPPMSTFLAAEGITLSEGYAADNIPNTATTIVVGNAISRGNPEIEEVLRRKLRYISLPELLKEKFLRGKRNLVVTGTHGKTTTSSLLAWFLVDGGLDPSHMIGGIPRNLGRGGYFSKSDFCVIEGDEYDTAFFDKRSKFHHYLPEVAIINNIEFDHADIFDNLDRIKLSFHNLMKIVPESGMVLLNGDDTVAVEIGAFSRAPIVEVGFSENAGNRIEEVRATPAKTVFRLLDHEFELPMHGSYNVRNAAMAISAAHYYGLSLTEIAGAVKAFQGVRRRQEVRGLAGGVRIIDDFAHHPTAIRHALEGLRAQYPKEKIWAVFEPRSNTTRRSIFQEQLTEALGKADGVVIAPVARAEQIEEADRLKPEAIVTTLQAAGQSAFFEPNVDSIVQRLVSEVKNGENVVVLSNGGFDNIHDRLLEAFAGK